MNLSARALVLIALTVALAIVGIWTSDTTLRGLWKLPAALILLGLAVEGVLLRRRPFSLFVDVSPRGYLGRPMNARMTLENRNRAPLTLEYAVDAPPGMKAPHGARILRAPVCVTLIVRFGSTPAGRPPEKRTLGKDAAMIMESRLLHCSYRRQSASIGGDS